MRRFFTATALRTILGLTLFSFTLAGCLPQPAASSTAITEELPAIAEPAPAPQPEEEDASPVNILVLGVDERPGDIGRSDTMLLVRVKDQQVQAVSIPRDTRIHLDEHGDAKINAAYVYGGPDLAKQAVSELLGVAVPYYVKVNTAGFRHIVDLLGGIPFDVPKRMYYRDDDQGLEIDLYPGEQILDGEKAEQFVRFRYDESGDDLSRIKRQQDFLKAAAKYALTPANLTKLPRLITAGLQYVETDVPFLKQVELAHAVFKAQSGDQISQATLPGTADYIDEISYFLLDEAGARTMLQGW